MSSKPNILVIMSDQHAPDAIGQLGHPVVQTPALNGLMDRGLTFTSAYSAYPMCTPARASFMTGHLAPEHGVWELGSPLRSDLPTWSHVLRRAGYRTTICGRMHFVGPDIMHGFEHRIFPQYAGVDPVSPHTYADWDEPQGVDHVMVEAVNGAGAQDGATRAEIYDRGVFEAAMAELDSCALNSDPWALTVGFFQPHFPFRISQPWFDQYEGLEIPLPRTPPAGESFGSLIPQQLNNSRKFLGLSDDGLTDDAIRMARCCYYAMISQVDDMIGRMVHRLDELGLADNTWIVYLSDHGENLGEHGLWSKLNFYEDSVRTPLIVVPPNYRMGGRKCGAHVSHIDWFPTVAELAGCETWIEEMPGRSLMPLLETPSESWRGRVVISDYACVGTRVPMRMVLRDNCKASFAAGLPPTLFDLTVDPHEWHDQASDPSRQSLIQDLEGLARQDGWDEHLILEHVRTLQRRLRFIGESESNR